MSSVYLASRYSRRLELLGYRTQLEAAGHQVTSRWLNGEHQALDSQLTELPTEVVMGFAREDWEDIKRAEILIAFTEPPRTTGTRGGRHVEWGVALAMKKICVAVGYRENVFYTLPQVKFFEQWDDCKVWLGTHEYQGA